MSLIGPIATFLCTAKFGRYRGIADIELAAPKQLDLGVCALAFLRRNETLLRLNFSDVGRPIERRR
jgi:hypothetical protein